MQKSIVTLVLGTLFALHCNAANASDMAVRITPDLERVEVEHAGGPVDVQRDQDQSNEVTPNFQRTSRKCPPFCIQPMHLPDGVETIGELEMLDYLRRAADGDDSVLIIDSRGPSWRKKGTIPGSIGLHYKKLSRRSAEEADIADILEHRFGAKRTEELWNFRHAKTLVMFCNGAWCGQSPTNIRSLMRMGYPASRLKWYRGGMQAWETLGLTTVVSESE